MPEMTCNERSTRCTLATLEEESGWMANWELCMNASVKYNMLFAEEIKLFYLFHPNNTNKKLSFFLKAIKGAVSLF